MKKEDSTASGRIFLQDEELHDKSEDFFRHVDLAANIRHILRKNEAPYNIAVIGKWGLGKSSLINLALEEFKQDSEYLCVNINAWKYEKEVLSRVFLRQVLQSLQDDPKTNQDRAKRSILVSLKELKRSFGNGSFSQFIYSIFKKYWKWGLVYVLASGGLYSAYKFIQCLMTPSLSKGIAYFWGMVVTGYLRNSATLLLIPTFLFILTNFVFDIKKNPFYRVGFQLPEMNVEDYEIELRKAINERYSGKKEPKIIITLDDLDRLDAGKMVEAIDAIKVFINFKNCIFIVPFDEQILSEAFQGQRMMGMTSFYYSSGEHLIDKLFQYKIYLNPPLSYDIKKYARTLCHNNLGFFFNKYGNEKQFFNALDRILIYPDITTPRQVKKLINNFISYLIIAKKREEMGSVPAGFSTGDDGIYTIAKLSVLQSNFGEFYLYLFEDDEAIEKVLTANNDAEAVSNLPIGLKRILDVDQNNNIPESATPLISFLTYTRKYGKENLLSYLYITEDDIAKETGSKAQQDFKHAAISNNVRECIRLMSENSKLPLVAENYIRYGTDPVAVVNIVSTMTVVARSVSLDYRKSVSDALSERAEDIAVYWDEEGIDYVDIEGLFIYYSMAENKKDFGALLDRYLDLYSMESDTTGPISVYAANYSVLEENTVRCLHSFIKNAIVENSINTQVFIDIRNKYNLNDPVWIKEYMDCLTEDIASKEDYSAKNIRELKAVYNIVFTEEKGKAFERLSPLYSSYEMTDVFGDILKESADGEIENGTICNLIMEQIRTEREIKESEKINHLLTIYDYKLKNAEDFSALDSFLEAQSKSIYMAAILETFLRQNTVSYIPETVNTIITNGFAEKDVSEIEAIKALLRAKDPDVTEEIYSKLVEASKYNKPSYEGMADLLYEMYLIDRGKASKLITGCINSFENRDITDRYIRFVGDYFAHDFHDDENMTELKKKYVTGITKKYIAGNNREEITEILGTLSESIEDEQFKKIEPVLYESVNADNTETIYKLFKERKHLFHKKEGGLSTKHYADMCLKAIDGTLLKNDAIRNLSEKFGWISDIPYLASQLNVNGVDRELVIDCCNKFINNKILSETGYIDAVHNICEIIYEHDLDYIEDIILNPDETLVRAMDIVADEPTEFSFDEMTAIFRWMLKHWRMKEVAVRMDEIMGILVDLSADKEQGDIVLELFDKVPTKIFSESKDKYITIFVNLIKKRYGSEYDKALLKMAKERRIDKKVIEQSPASIEKDLKDMVSEIS